MRHEPLTQCLREIGVDGQFIHKSAELFLVSTFLVERRHRKEQLATILNTIP